MIYARGGGFARGYSAADSNASARPTRYSSSKFHYSIPYC